MSLQSTISCSSFQNICPDFDHLCIVYSGKNSFPLSEIITAYTLVVALELVSSFHASFSLDELTLKEKPLFPFPEWLSGVISAPTESANSIICGLIHPL